MRKTFLWAGFVVLTAACSSKAEDLNNVCKAFAALSEQPNMDAMSYQQRFSFLDQRVRENVSRFSQSMTLWEAMGACEPSRCYPIFQRMAEELIGQPWSCPAMGRVAPLMHPPETPTSP